MKKGYVYILSNYRRTTFYIGVTSNLGQRLQQHQEGGGSKFVEKYNLKYLVYYEEFDQVVDAIKREKQLKKWHRDWKLRLIKSVDPELKICPQKSPGAGRLPSDADLKHVGKTERMHPRHPEPPKTRHPDMFLVGI